MCLSGHVGMMAAGNNEGCSLVSFRRYKSRSTRAGKKKIGKASSPARGPQRKTRDTEEWGGKWWNKKGRIKDKADLLWLPRKSAVYWWKTQSYIISVSLWAIYANQTYLLLARLAQIITLSKEKKNLFEQETALFIQLKETMSEWRINSLLTAASTIWLNQHPY